MNAKIREIYLLLIEKMEVDEVSPYKELEIIKNRLKDWELNLKNKTEKLGNVEKTYGELKSTYEKIFEENASLKKQISTMVDQNVYESKIDLLVRENEVLKNKLQILENKLSDIAEIKLNYDVQLRENSDLADEKQNLLDQLNMLENANRDLQKKFDEAQTSSGTVFFHCYRRPEVSARSALASGSGCGWRVLCECLGV